MPVQRFSYLFIALSGSLLLSVAWPVSPMTLLIFIAWVPLLWIEDHIRNWKRLLGVAYIHMLIWNVITTWWIWNASPPGAMGAFIANSLIMCLPWLLFYFTKKTFGRWIGYTSLIAYWLTFEYIHHHWELSWPWLTLGNAFATHPEWVQWYQVTGHTGGSLWILLVNIIAYQVFRENRSNGRTRRYYQALATWIALLTFPILISKVIIGSEQRKLAANMRNAVHNVVVVQPNVDPYHEKFSSPVESQVQRLIVLSEQQVDQKTSLVVWPETAIPAQVWEDEIKENRYYYPVWSFLQRHPNISLVTGIDSYKRYGPDKSNAPATSRYDEHSNNYYDAFNTAAFFDADTSISLYHKAKLVPGVETLPSFLNFMGSWFEEFGGISGTLGRDSERKVFVTRDKSFSAAPVICYESIYGEYITDYIRKGANILTIITNDGWWGDTPGYKQHMNYGRLRAIETRKWVARSANTGISCFIDPMGNVINPQPWDAPGVIRQTIAVDNRLTFFVKYGDIIAKAAVGCSMLLSVFTLLAYFKNRLNKRSGTAVS
jgi:apolipoprotein N-acyltransferase